MAEREVWMFFYGSFINKQVLAESDIQLDDFDVARLHDFDIEIAPLATLVPSRGARAYGIVTSVPNTKVRALYEQDWVRHYYPEGVLVKTRDGREMAALCYICSHEEKSPPTADYVEKIAGPAEAYGFPEWYVEKIRRFSP
jgi:cation transport regulator ChaC